MLLKRLTSQLPEHLHPLLPQLDAAGIKTTENLLFTHPSLLRGLIPHEASLEELHGICLALTAPPEVWGDEAYRAGARTARRSWCGWGIGAVDELIAGWDGTGVVELVGPSRVGKSLLALHAALRVLRAEPTAQCRWLDADGSFHPTRARAILDAMGEKDPTSVLDRLVVSPCFRIDPELYEGLAAIKAEYERDEDDADSVMRTRILVIDPLSSLLKDMLLASTAQGHAAMVTVLEEISELTYSCGLATVITNFPSSSLPNNAHSSFSMTTIRPALGTAFTYFADVTLLVQETGKLFGQVDEEERERVRKQPGLRAAVEVLKSRVSPSGRWAVFETDGTSLSGVVPPPFEDERTIRMSAGLPVGVQRPIHGPLARTVIP
ncbi:hypothetical protein JCM24511_00913 [Saitozyma sp. JCM 24511]|nr:hypothetical protein JCM24511_00913 [Saitozyma sp. JCM 24511]